MPPSRQIPPTALQLAARAARRAAYQEKYDAVKAAKLLAEEQKILDVLTKYGVPWTPLT
jgi:hypothetical protein